MKHSMENFFKWIMVPVPSEEVIIWFNMNNIHYEKVELFGDILKSLNHIIVSTYLGGGEGETAISLTEDNKISHFDWCWNKIVKDFSIEKTQINEDGEHKNYLLDFYLDTFYSSDKIAPNEDMSKFFNDIFNLDNSYTKSDLEILTQIYKVMDKNVY
jgi:hypothetical protein